MLSFPSFSGNFYNNTPLEQGVIGDSTKVVLNIERMTCGGCESQVNRVLNKTEGVISCDTSYKEASVTIIYDKEVTDAEGLSEIISKKTRFKVTGIKDE
jgi:copper chaperone